MSTLPQTLAVIGAQWGDEGKGKIVDVLASKYDYCCRFNGGSNAGHTIVFVDPKSGEKKKFGLHLLPSGVFCHNSTSVIGNGTILHLPSLLTEIELLEKNGFTVENRFLISNRCHIVLEMHQQVDGLQENERADQKIGTTHKGIGPCYSDKASRNGLRMCDLDDMEGIVRPRIQALASSYQKRFPQVNIDIEKEIEILKNAKKRLASFIVDTAIVLHKAYQQGKTILFEGANATYLDNDFGTYPFVTSSHPTTSGIFIGTGFAYSMLKGAVGVVKAYTTRVGEGPFVTEFADTDPLLKQIREVGGEYGTTTGRARRCGWLDIPMLKYSTLLNGFTDINLTKLDTLANIPKLKICVAYKLDGKTIDYVPADLSEYKRIEPEYVTVDGWNDDISKCKTFDSLPKTAQEYVLLVEKLMNCHIRWIGVGSQRDEMIERLHI